MESHGERRMVETVAFKDRNVDAPPEGDVCPICFDEFTVPCRSSCGHWFCASCFLQFWNHRNAFQLSECPMCFRTITKLSPQAPLLTRGEAEVVQVIKSIERYNSLYVGGCRAFFMKIRPLLHNMKPAFQEDGVLVVIVYTLILQFIVILHKILCMLDYISSGVLIKLAWYDTFVVALPIVIFLLVIGFHLVFRRRARRLAARQPQNN